MGFNCLKATVTSRRQFTFYHSVPRNSWCSFYRPRKDERLSRPWCHPVVLNTGLVDWESSTLTTRLKWSVAAKASPYICGSKCCDLCFTERLLITKADPRTLLNKRSEIVSKCHHHNKFALKCFR